MVAWISALAWDGLVVCALYALAFVSLFYWDKPGETAIERTLPHVVPLGFGIGVLIATVTTAQTLEPGSRWMRALVVSLSLPGAGLVGWFFVPAPGVDTVASALRGSFNASTLAFVGALVSAWVLCMPETLASEGRTRATTGSRRR